MVGMGAFQWRENFKWENLKDEINKGGQVKGYVIAKAWDWE